MQNPPDVCACDERVPLINNCNLIIRQGLECWVCCLHNNEHVGIDRTMTVDPRSEMDHVLIEDAAFYFNRRGIVGISTEVDRRNNYFEYTNQCRRNPNVSKEFE